MTPHRPYIIGSLFECGEKLNNYPGWFTRVSSYTEWINCIIDKSFEYNNNQKKIEEECSEVAKKIRKCIADSDLILQCPISEEERCKDTLNFGVEENVDVINLPPKPRIQPSCTLNDAVFKGCSDSTFKWSK